MNKENAKGVLRNMLDDAERYEGSEQWIGENTMEAIRYALTLFDEVDRLKEELSQIKSAYVATMNEICEESDDRQHCTCVPFLREEIARLNGRVKEINKKRGLVIGENIELKTRVGKLQEYEWMYKDLCK